MAYSIFVSNVTITPVNFTYGDTATITATITNNGSSGDVEGVSFYVYGSGDEELGFSGWGYNGIIAKNSSKTLTMQINFNRDGARAVRDELIANETRSMSGLTLRACSTPKGSTSVIDNTTNISSLFFDEHKAINISDFETFRCDSNGDPANEGTYAAYTVDYTMPTGFTAVLYYQTESGYNNITLNGSTTGTVVSGAQFSTTQSYDFSVRISDGVEELVVSTLLPAAAANVHLSGHDTGGVALGRFSSATLGVPKFESNYQATFYKGITGVNVYREAEVLTGGRWIDNKPLYRKTFHIVRQSGSSDIGPADGDGFILVAKANLPNYAFVHIIDAVATYSYNSVSGYWSGSYANGAGTSQLQHDNLRFYIHPGSGLKIQHGSYMMIDEVWVTIEYTVVGDTAVETDNNGNALGYSVAIRVPDDSSGGGSDGGGDSGGDSGDDTPTIRYLVEIESQTFHGNWNIHINSPDNDHYAWFKLESGSAEVDYVRNSSTINLTQHLNTWTTISDFNLVTGGNDFIIIGNNAVISVKYTTSASVPPSDSDEIIDDGDTSTGYPANRTVELDNETKSITLGGYTNVVPIFIVDSANISMAFTSSANNNPVGHTLSFDSSLGLEKGINVYSDCAMTSGTNTYTFTGTGTVVVAFAGRTSTNMPMAMSDITGGRYKYYSSGVRVMPVFKVTSVSSLGANFAKYTTDYSSYLKQHSMGRPGTFEFEDMLVAIGQTAHVYSGSPYNEVSVSYYLVQD